MHTDKQCSSAPCVHVRVAHLKTAQPLAGDNTVAADGGVKVSTAADLMNPAKTKSMSLDLDKLQADKRLSASAHDATTPRDVITTPTEQMARNAAKR